MHILKLLATSSFITVNKDLIRFLNTDVAVLTGHFCSCHVYHKGWFFQTYEKIEEETGIKTHSARKAIKLMTEAGLIETKRQGVPCMTYYQVNEENLLTFLLSEGKEIDGEDKKCENDRTRNVKTIGLEVSNSHTSYYNKNKEDKNTKNNKEEVSKDTIEASGEASPKQYSSHGSKRRSNQPEQSRSSNHSEQINLSESEERKKWGCTAAAWLEYSPAVFHWNGRFRSMANVKFPKDYDVTGPNHVSVSGASKTLLKIVDFIDQTCKGRFLQLYSVNRTDIKKKYKVVYTALQNAVTMNIEDITEALQLHQDFFVEGNWPEDKKTVPRDLASWIFNFKTKNSWFLMCLEKVKTGNRDHVTRELKLSRRAVGVIRGKMEWFEEPEADVLEVFTHWWDWMSKKIAFVESRKGFSGEDLTSVLGSKPENAWHWIEEYINWVIDRWDESDLRAGVVGAKSKWAVNYIREQKRNNPEQEWDLEFEEYDKNY